MAAEILALVMGFDYAFVVGNLVLEILNRDVALEPLRKLEDRLRCTQKVGEDLREQTPSRRNLCRLGV